MPIPAGLAPCRRPTVDGGRRTTRQREVRMAVSVPPAGTAEAGAGRGVDARVSATGGAAGPVPGAPGAAGGGGVAVIGTARVKRGMADMLKGGVIMDVVTPEQARIAEDAG